MIRTYLIMSLETRPKSELWQKVIHFQSNKLYKDVGWIFKGYTEKYLKENYQYVS